MALLQARRDVALAAHLLGNQAHLTQVFRQQLGVTRATTVGINDTILIKPSSSVRRAAQDVLSWIMLLLEHADGLFSYALALTRNVHEAEDLVQETYLRAIAAIDHLREDGNAKAWLYTILRNIRLNQVRQQRIRPKLLELDAHENSEELLVEAGKDPHAQYVSKMEIRRVREALQQLSEEFREIILLREFAELSYQEIATLLGCAPGTVMSRLARARSKLRTLLSAPTAGSERAADSDAFIVEFQKEYCSSEG